MCLLALAYKVHPAYPLVLVANRDEFLDRPALPAHYWTDAPAILAGRDLNTMGTWLGITTMGSFVALTNYRDLQLAEEKRLSRGILVRRVLEEGFMGVDTSLYAACNLIHGSLDELRYHSNVHNIDERLEPGIHALSNHLLNTPWPKVIRAKAALTNLMIDPHPSIEGLFAMLMDDRTAADDELPDTGVGLEWERILSPIYIRSGEYGTRCSTVLICDQQGRVHFEERTHHPFHIERHRVEWSI